VIRNSEVWGGLFWLAVGAFVIWAGRDMGLGRLNDPGNGFSFFWIGILMCGLAAGIIAQAVLSGGPTVASLWAGTHWGKVLVVVGLLIAYAFAFQSIGFIPCTLVLLLVIMWFVDPVKWWLAALIAVTATFGVWYVLNKVLRIQLPPGILENIL
jgi:putative tricarboxylic transport membrane protein